MGLTDVFEAAGGGLLGLLSIAVVTLFGMLLHNMNARLKDRDSLIADLREDLKERRQEVKDLTAAVNRQSDVIEAWTPQAQRRAVRR